jgi:hypothetical protein
MENVEMTRRIDVIVNADGMDFEDIGTNQRGFLNTTQTSFLEEGMSNVPILNARFGFGGEVRGEIALVGSINNSELFAHGDALLFEGTSEDTSDLDGRETVNFNVKKGDTLPHSITVRNTDENSQDRVTWNLTVTNRIVE